MEILLTLRIKDKRGILEGKVCYRFLVRSAWASIRNEERILSGFSLASKLYESPDALFHEYGPRFVLFVIL